MNNIFKNINYVFCLLAVILILSCTSETKKELYFLGQEAPSMEAKRFAKEILFTEITDEVWEELHSSIFFSPDSKEMFYTIQNYSRITNRYKQKIMMIEFKEGKWSSPKIAPFSGEHDDIFVAFSLDGKRLYFRSDRPHQDTSKQKTGKMWFAKKVNGEWGNPQFIGSLIDGVKDTKRPTFTAKNDVYYYQRFPKEAGSGDIMKSEFIDDKYVKPERLGASINSPHYECFPLISKEEDYLIFYRLIPGGETGQYISFKDENGDWSEAINLGKQFNEGGTSFSASFSPDGKYIFYLLRSDKESPTDRETGIYWIDAKILKSFKK
jgi:hypothetical protein